MSSIMIDLFEPRMVETKLHKSFQDIRRDSADAPVQSVTALQTL